MQESIKKDINKQLHVNSGFRSMPHQIELKQKSIASGGKPATARPGYSNHQNGNAVDLAGTNDGSQAGKWGVPGHTTEKYLWLVRNAHTFGFARTVNSESWHWLYMGVAKATSYRTRHWKRYQGYYYEAYRAWKRDGGPSNGRKNIALKNIHNIGVDVNLQAGKQNDFQTRN